MKNEPTTRRTRRFKTNATSDWSTAGFSAIETIIVVVVLSVLLSIAVPATGEAMRHAAVNRAMTVVQTDLRRAHSLAARQRSPVRMIFNASRKAYVFVDTESGDTLLSRSFGDNTEYALSSMTVSTSPVDIAPTGFASSALAIKISAHGYSRAVMMLRGGMVRMVR